MTSTGLVAVVVTFNRLEKLQVTVLRLLASPPDVLEGVVVFDNASSDSTGDWLKTQTDPRLNILTSPRNLGGAGGFEAAMRSASDRFDPDWMVLMDDDARPAPGALEAFRAAPRAEAEAWAAAVTYPDGLICDMNRPWTNPFRSWHDVLRLLRFGRDGFHLSRDHYAETETLSIDGGSFVGLFVSRQAIARVGYPDSTLFLYGDDVLYTLSLSQAGGAIRFDPGLRFEHDCDTLSGGASRVMSPLWKVYYYHRNQVMVYRRAAGPVLFWPVLVMRAMVWVIRARAYGSQRAPYLRLLCQALWDGVRGRTGEAPETVMALAKA